MRLLFGVIIGAGLTIGGAYLYDSLQDGPLASEQRLVNWDVAGRVAGEAYGNVRAQIWEWMGDANADGGSPDKAIVGSPGQRSE